MTKRLFDVNPYQQSFAATVLSQHPYKGDKWGVVLDQTAFYPESGGQPYDIGTLAHVDVEAVFEEGETIVHIVNEPLKKEHVTGTIDFQRRFDHMQQHAGQHVLSAAFQQVAKLETVAFHLGRAVCTIDIATSAINEHTLKQVEQVANNIVMENRHIESRFYTRAEIEADYLTKVPENENSIRMVHIVDYDLSACCGTHPFRTGEIGLVKVLHVEKHRGNSRVSFVCGHRSLSVFQKEHELINNVTKRLKTNQEQLLDKLQMVLDESKQLSHTNRTYYQQLVIHEAEHFEPSLSLTIDGQYCDLFFFKYKERSAQQLKDLAKTIIERNERIVFFITFDETKRIYQWIIACSDSVPLSVKVIIETIKQKLGGNGGGSRVFGQWSGTYKELNELDFISNVLLR